MSLSAATYLDVNATVPNGALTIGFVSIVDNAQLSGPPALSRLSYSSLLSPLPLPLAWLPRPLALSLASPLGIQVFLKSLTLPPTLAPTAAPTVVPVATNSVRINCGQATGTYTDPTTNLVWQPDA